MIEPPLFLTLDNILTIHERTLALGGGSAGILSQKMLESATNAPQASYGGKYLNSFPYEMAAAYLISFSKNHAFCDGNKRTALAVTAAFLALNGMTLHFPSKKAEADFVLDVATSRIKKDDVAGILCAHCT